VCRLPLRGTVSQGCALLDIRLTVIAMDVELHPKPPAAVPTITGVVDSEHNPIPNNGRTDDTFFRWAWGLEDDCASCCPIWRRSLGRPRVTGKWIGWLQSEELQALVGCLQWDRLQPGRGRNEQHHF